MKPQSRPSLLAAIALAAVLTVSGCATTIAGTATAGTRISGGSGSVSGPASTAPSTPDQSAPRSEETTSGGSGPQGMQSTQTPVPPVAPSPGTGGHTAGGSPGASPGAGATDLDTASLNWLKAFCTGFSDVAQYIGPDTTGLDKDQTVAKVVGAYQGMSDAATRAAQQLEEMPQPDFPGHETVVRGLHDWFEAVASVYGKGARTIANGTFDTPRDLTRAIDQVEANMDQPNKDLTDTIGAVDPSVKAALLSLPQCQVLTHGTG